MAQIYKKSLDNRRLITAKQSFFSEKPLMGREGDSGSYYAEHVIVSLPRQSAEAISAHRIVIHKQFASEVFFAIPLATVGFLEVVEFVSKLEVISTAS